MPYSDQDYHNDLEKLKKEQVPYEVMTKTELEASWKKNNMEETKKMENVEWLKNEANEIANQPKPANLKPALKLEENKETIIEVDFSKEFEKWTDPDDTSRISKIIPVKVNGVDMVWFLNVKNPTYKEIITSGAAGTTKFRILRTGQQKNTRYIILK
jgi:hypothetical protein